MRVDEWWTGKNEREQANCPTTPHPLILLTISTGTVLLTLESGGKRVMEGEKHRKKKCVTTSVVKQHSRVCNINLVDLYCLFQTLNFFLALSDQTLKAFVSTT